MSDKTVAELMALHRIAATRHAEWCLAGPMREKQSADEAFKAERALEQAIRRAVDSAALSAEPAQERADELETLRMQLVACGVAALSNTRESAAQQRVPRDSPYWTASYGDVCKAVEREMDLREKLETLLADRASRLPELTDEQIVSAMLAGSGGDPVWMRLTHKQMIAAGRAVEALVRGKT